MPTLKTYGFGASSFTNFVWLNGGQGFENISILSVEMTNTGAYAAEVWQVNGGLVRRDENQNDHGGWASFYYDQGGYKEIPDGVYRVRLVNIGPGTRIVHGGTLDWKDYQPWDAIKQKMSAAVRAVTKIFG